jgi:ABC-type cobalamin transport system permease subunit
MLIFFNYFIHCLGSTVVQIGSLMNEPAKGRRVEQSIASVAVVEPHIINVTIGVQWRRMASRAAAAGKNLLAPRDCIAANRCGSGWHVERPEIGR